MMNHSPLSFLLATMIPTAYSDQLSKLVCRNDAIILTWQHIETSSHQVAATLELSDLRAGEAWLSSMYGTND